MATRCCNEYVQQRVIVSFPWLGQTSPRPYDDERVSTGRPERTRRKNTKVLSDESDEIPRHLHTVTSWSWRTRRPTDRGSSVFVNQDDADESSRHGRDSGEDPWKRYNIASTRRSAVAGRFRHGPFDVVDTTIPISKRRAEPYVRAAWSRRLV